MPKIGAVEQGDTEPLQMRLASIDVLLALQQDLRTDERLYHDCVLFLRKLQRADHGSLTEAFAVLVGRG